MSDEQKSFSEDCLTLVCLDSRSLCARRAGTCFDSCKNWLKSHPEWVAQLILSSLTWKKKLRLIVSHSSVVCLVFSCSNCYTSYQTREEYSPSIRHARIKRAKSAIDLISTIVSFALRSDRDRFVTISRALDFRLRSGVGPTLVENRAPVVVFLLG